MDSVPLHLPPWRVDHVASFPETIKYGGRGKCGGEGSAYVPKGRISQEKEERNTNRVPAIRALASTSLSLPSPRLVLRPSCLFPID